MSEPLGSVAALPPDGLVTDPSEWVDFAEEIADQVESFLVAIRAIAAGQDTTTTLSLLLLETSQLALAGGRLGAVTDIVPVERFEPDPGFDPDVDELRERLAGLLAPVDDYVEVLDPADASRGAATFLLSDDLAAISSDLLHGLQHHRQGKIVEALWWWQFSYLGSWGSTLGGVLRALHSLIAHTRLDSRAD